MKKFKFISNIFVLSTIITGCQKEFSEDKTVVSPQKGYSEITAYFADSQGKTVLDEQDASVLWNPRDEILLIYNTARIKFVSTNKTPSKTATFISDYHLIFGGLGDNTESKLEKPCFYGIYPYSNNNLQSAIEENCFSILVPALQKGVKGSFARTSFPAVGCSSDTNIAFHNVCGGVCFSLTQSGVQYVTIEGNANEVLAGYAEVTIDNDGFPSSLIEENESNTTRVTLVAPSKEGFEVGATYYISMLPNSFSTGITMTFHKADSVATLSSSKQLVIKRSTFGRITSADQGLEYVPASKVEAVDLGLSVNWATCNIGALLPEEDGMYFAQSSTYGQKWDGVVWSNYGFDYSPRGQTDSLDVLLPQDDAARVILGEKWRMPTYGELKELRDNTKKTWTDNYNNSGVSGVIFQSTVLGYEDKQIFMPASGFGLYLSLSKHGRDGYYWTATLGCGFKFTDEVTSLGFYDSQNGFPIRPVTAAE